MKAPWAFETVAKVVLASCLAGVCLPGAPRTPQEPPAPARPVVVDAYDWDTQFVDAPRYFYQMGNRSLKRDKAGHPYIAYGGDHLYYARHDGSQWRTERIDNWPGVGECTSLALDEDDHPHISCTNDGLIYAEYDGAAWRFTDVEYGYGIGWWNSIALGGRPRAGVVTRRISTDRDTLPVFAHLIAPPVSTAAATWGIICGMSNKASQASEPDSTRRLIAGAIAELDLEQIAVTRRLTPAQRFQEGLSMIRLAEQVGAYRLRQRRPELSEAEALRIIRSRE